MPHASEETPGRETPISVMGIALGEIADAEDGRSLKDDEDERRALRRKEIQEKFIADLDRMVRVVGITELDTRILKVIVDFGKEVFADKGWREDISLEVFQHLQEFYIDMEIGMEFENAWHLKVLAEIFRFCRNASAYSTKNQESIGHACGLGGHAVMVARSLIIKRPELLETNADAMTLAQIAIQLTYNTLTGVPAVWDHYWKSCDYLNDLLVYVNHPNYKLAFYSSLTLLEVYKIDPSAAALAGASDNQPSDNTDNSKPPFDAFYTKSLCRFTEFFEREFDGLSDDDKIVAMENIANSQDYQGLMTLAVLRNFMDLYKKECESFLAVAKPQDLPTERLELLKWYLILMVTLASLEGEKLKHMREDEEFVNFTIIMLSRIHKIGKVEPPNCFSPLENLELVAPSGPRSQEIQEIENHPFFMAKHRFLALITYLCSNHQKNQDIARKYDGLSVILECTKIDARNPYLPQRSVVALRCILENNPTNQKFVASMDKKGLAPSETNNLLTKEFKLRMEDRRE